MHAATGIASGIDRAENVISQILTSRLLGTSAEGAKNVLLFITAPSSVGLEEVDKISSAVAKKISAEGNIIFGMDFDDSMGDQIKVVLIATHKS